MKESVLTSGYGSAILNHLQAPAYRYPGILGGLENRQEGLDTLGHSLHQRGRVLPSLTS